MVNDLCAEGPLRSPRIEAAMRTVRRHTFVPEVSVEEAYADKQVYTKHNDAGVAIGGAPRPSIAATMLEQAEVEKGHAVLEIGAGTGYNAGLLAYLAGATGHVTTIDVDGDVVDEARAALAAEGFGHVHVVHDDGALGHHDGAPYDRIVASVGVHGVPLAWLDQLAPGGRLVVPLRLRGSVSRLVAVERDNNGRWYDIDSEMCTFMPLRGILDDTRHTIPLTPDRAVCLEIHRDQEADPETLTGVLRQRRVEVWTGVRWGGLESIERLYLWLACVLPNAISRMFVEPAAVDHGLVDPQFGWGAMATFDQSNLAYLAVRKHIEEGYPRLELGIVGHGTACDGLVDRMVDAVRLWGRRYRLSNVDFEIQPTPIATSDIEVDGTNVPVAPPNRFVIDTPLSRIIVSWLLT